MKNQTSSRPVYFNSKARREVNRGFTMPLIFLMMLAAINCYGQEPIGRWLFNGNAAHFSDPGLNGTEVGGTTYGDGVDGTGQGSIQTSNGKYISIPQGNVLDVTGSFTVSLWWKGQSNNNSITGAIGRMGFSGSRGWSFGPDNTGRVGFTIATSSTSTVGIVLNGVNEPARWVHWVAIFDGVAGSLEIFKDGQSVGTNTTGIPASMYNNTSLNIKIGQRGDGFNYLVGDIDNVRIYDRAITPSEIASVYAQELTTCANGIYDGDEEGVDCGGATCPPCDEEPGGPDGDWVFVSGEEESDPIFRTGSVAIGLLDPGPDKLAVDGTIRTREVKVSQDGWADYVFKPDYGLMSLADLKKYIAENGRLPNIPSEDQVVSEGIMLGKMNKRLLEKIEELTLYILQQEERIIRLEVKK